MNKLKGVIGITNKTEDKKYIPFLDYDIDFKDKDYSSNIIDVYADIKDLQNKYKIGNAFIIGSNNGFNVFFLDKLNYSDCVFILNDSLFCDKKFLKYAVEKKNMTLRLGKDKKFVYVIDSIYLNKTLSKPHYDFFCDFFKTDILGQVKKIKNRLCFDNSTYLQFVRYMSKKYGYIEVD